MKGEKQFGFAVVSEPPGLQHILFDTRRAKEKKRAA